MKSEKQDSPAKTLELLRRKAEKATESAAASIPSKFFHTMVDGPKPGASI